jgi:hypothetical protein
MGVVRNVMDDGLGGLEHNFLTGRIEDVVTFTLKLGRNVWSCVLCNRDDGNRHGAL